MEGATTEVEDLDKAVVADGLLQVVRAYFPLVVLLRRRVTSRAASVA